MVPEDYEKLLVRKSKVWQQPNINRAKIEQISKDVRLSGINSASKKHELHPKQIRIFLEENGYDAYGHDKITGRKKEKKKVREYDEIIYLSRYGEWIMR